MNKYLLISLFCFLLSFLYYIFHLIFIPQISIGIVGVDNISNVYLEIAKKGFDDNYKDYFDVEILDFKINSSNISFENLSTNYKYYKNSDFFRVLENKTVIDLNYDYYLIVTDKKILDYDESSMGFWGQASTKYRMALITVEPFNSLNEYDNFIISNHAVHEVLHLIGYLHNIYDRSGIMQYTNTKNMNLVSYYKFQLPVKIFWSKYLKVKNFMLNSYIMNLVFYPVIFLFFLGIDFLIKAWEYHKFKFVVKDYQIFLMYNMILFMFGIFFNYVFYLFFIILILQFFLHLYVLNQKKVLTKINF